VAGVGLLVVAALDGSCGGVNGLLERTWRAVSGALSHVYGREKADFYCRFLACCLPCGYSYWRYGEELCGGAWVLVAAKWRGCCL
jgi:hypothetical protein